MSARGVQNIKAQMTLDNNSTARQQLSSRLDVGLTQGDNL
nr:hypothetical protein SYMBAF_120026 [Serratia symbiotica]